MRMSCCVALLVACGCASWHRQDVMFVSEPPGAQVDIGVHSDEEVRYEKHDVAPCTISLYRLRRPLSVRYTWDDKTCVHVMDYHISCGRYCVTAVTLGLYEPAYWPVRVAGTLCEDGTATVVETHASDAKPNGYVRR